MKQKLVIFSTDCIITINYMFLFMFTDVKPFRASTHSITVHEIIKTSTATSMFKHKINKHNMCFGFFFVFFRVFNLL